MNSPAGAQDFSKSTFLFWKSFIQQVLITFFLILANRLLDLLSVKLIYIFSFPCSFQLYPQMKALLCHVWSCVSQCAVRPVSTLLFSSVVSFMLTPAPLCTPRHSFLCLSHLCYMGCIASCLDFCLSPLKYLLLSSLFSFLKICAVIIET